jgi:hypothetical protein
MLRILVGPRGDEHQYGSDETERLGQHQRHCEPHGVGIQRAGPPPIEIGQSEDDEHRGEQLIYRLPPLRMRNGRGWRPVFKIFVVRALGVGHSGTKLISGPSLADSSECSFDEWEDRRETGRGDASEISSPAPALRIPTEMKDGDDKHLTIVTVPVVVYTVREGLHHKTPYSVIHRLRSFWIGGNELESIVNALGKADA